MNGAVKAQGRSRQYDVHVPAAWTERSRAAGAAVDRLPLELWPGHTVAFLGPSGRASRCRWTCCSRCASRLAAESAAILMEFVAAPHERWPELAKCVHGTEHVGDAAAIKSPAVSL